MRLHNLVYDLIFDRIMQHSNVEYSGTHNADPKAPLWGRCAYYRIDGRKVTFPVTSINPRPSTLRRLLKAELRRRFEAIEDVVEANEYGSIYIVARDPYSVRSLLEQYACGYTGIPFKKKSA